MELDSETLERLVPDELDGDDLGARATLELHVERYEFAVRQVPSGRLLDIACGVGYGTRILADRCPQLEEALGVDISSGAIEYARRRYGDERLSYRVADAMDFDDPEGFDAIVSLETVEHLPDPVRFFARIAGMLRPGGVLVSSVPTTPSVDLNPHHLHDFSAAQFRELGASHGLLEIDCFEQVQRARLADLASGRRFGPGNLRPNLPLYYLTHPVALLRRVAVTLRFGLENHYLTVAWRRDG